MIRAISHAEMDEIEMMLSMTIVISHIKFWPRVSGRGRAEFRHLQKSQKIRPRWRLEDELTVAWEWLKKTRIRQC
jgi:hypothetical protein